MTTLSTDSFNRASSSTTLGSTDGAGTKDPATWTAQIGTWGISFNEAYSPVLSGSRALATVDLATADVDLTVNLTINTSQIAGVAFRCSDASNFLMFRYFGTQAMLQKVVAGATSTVSFTTFSGNGSNDVYRVVATGSTISGYRNGSLLFTVTESFNQTATKHGLYSEDTGILIDSWSALSATVVTTVTGTQAIETDTANTGVIATATNVPAVGDRVLAFKTATSADWYGFDLNLI